MRPRGHRRVYDVNCFVNRRTGATSFNRRRKTNTTSSIFIESSSLEITLVLDSMGGDTCVQAAPPAWDFDLTGRSIAGATTTKPHLRRTVKARINKAAVAPTSRRPEQVSNPVGCDLRFQQCNSTPAIHCHRYCSSPLPPTHTVQCGSSAFRDRRTPIASAMAGQTQASRGFAFVASGPHRGRTDEVNVGIVFVAETSH